MQNALLRWYDQHKRILPWRKNHDPYRIWISEIMLQQTQVITVIDYFERWMKTYPSLASLAKAPIESVLKHWEGLGYYRRAHQIHACAQILVQEHQGKFPQTREAMLSLPGIGPYTAAAILSIAFEQKEAVLDGNVERVLCRYLNNPLDTSLPKNKKELWTTAQSLLPSKRIGDYNQALMELGATVCTPKNWNCEACPLKPSCQAYRQQSVAVLPFKSKKINILKRTRVALIVSSPQGLLLQFRNSKRLLNGLWEIPNFELKSSNQIKSITQNFLKEMNFKTSRPPEKLSSFQYSITRFRIEMKVIRVYVKSNKKIEWIKFSELKHKPMPGPQRKYLDQLFKN